MTRGAIEHNEQMMLGVGFRELFEEYLQTSAIHPRQVKAEALSCGGLDRRIEVSPLVGAPHDVGRAKAFGAVAPPVPVDQAKTRLVKGHHLQRFLTVMILAASPYGLGEVFLKASCSCGSASSCRGRPVLS